MNHRDNTSATQFSSLLTKSTVAYYDNNNGIYLSVRYPRSVWLQYYRIYSNTTVGKNNFSSGFR